MASRGYKVRLAGSDSGGYTIRLQIFDELGQVSWHNFTVASKAEIKPSIERCIKLSDNESRAMRAGNVE